MFGARSQGELSLRQTLHGRLPQQRGGRRQGAVRQPANRRAEKTGSRVHQEESGTHTHVFVISVLTTNMLIAPLNSYHFQEANEP